MLEKFSNDYLRDVDCYALTDWLKNLAAVFNQWEEKPIAPLTRDYSRALTKLLLIARGSDWFIALPTPVVIDKSNYFGIGFSRVMCKLLRNSNL